MPFANYASTTTLYALVEGVAAELEQTVASLQNILNVRTPARASQRLVDICNERQRWLLSQNPMLGRTTVQVTLTAGTNTQAIPDNLFRQSLVDIQWNQNGAWMGLPLNFLAPDQFRMQWGWPQDSQQTGYASQFPCYWTWDATNENIVFASFWQSGDYLLTFVESPEEWTIDDLVDPDPGATASVIPDDYIRVLVLLIAEVMARTMKDKDALASIQDELYARRSPDVAGALRQMQEDIGTTLAATTRQYASNGQPVQSGMPLVMGGIGGLNFRSGGVGGWPG